MKYPKRSQYKHAKARYRVRNWAEYEAGLRSRGDLTVWLTDDALNTWRALPSGKLGGQRTYATFAGQRVEVRLACGILNTMTSLGMPESYRVA